MKVELCPSLMCARYGDLEGEIKRLQDAGADYFHIDVMDGKYVHNFGMGLQDIEYITRSADVPCELHLMVEEPGEKLDIFAKCDVDVIYIHPESEYHAITTLQKIQNMGIKSGLVINPGTSVESILELLNVVDRVMVMGVNPGHAGQLYLPFAEKKIDRLLNLREEYNFSIGVDGAVTLELISKLSRKGVKHFVLGTAALFHGDYDYKRNFEVINSALEED